MNQVQMMFKKAIGKFGFLFLMLVAMMACDNNDEGINVTGSENEITVNGGPFTNFTARGERDGGSAVYDVQENLTVVSYTPEISEDEYFHVILSFRGNTTGEYPWDVEEDCFFQASYHKDSNSSIVITSYNASDTVLIENGSVKIDSYGEPGGVIEGSFEGDCMIRDVDCSTCPISEGTLKGEFKVTRVY